MACADCGDLFTEIHKVSAVLPCGHAFCQSCIDFYIEEYDRETLGMLTRPFLDMIVGSSPCNFCKENLCLPTGCCERCTFMDCECSDDGLSTLVVV